MGRINVQGAGDMNGTAEIFESNRTRLLGIAHRMLRSRTDAEDLVQDAYLRWHQSAAKGVESPTAFLVTITTRLCLDRLRELKREREHHAGPWLPEITPDERIAAPEESHERAQEASAAFVRLIERLGPGERTAFLLHEVFDYDYPEVARILGKSEPACRQIVRRARVRVREPQVRITMPAALQERMVNRFLIAMASGDRKDVMALLSPDLDSASGKADGRIDVPAIAYRTVRTTLHSASGRHRPSFRPGAWRTGHGRNDARQACVI
jgi:RNA polymerase sigma-70 factor (ECF subfamily)